MYRFDVKKWNGVDNTQYPTDLSYLFYKADKYIHVQPHFVLNRSQRIRVQLIENDFGIWIKWN